MQSILFSNIFFTVMEITYEDMKWRCVEWNSVRLPFVIVIELLWRRLQFILFIRRGLLLCWFCYAWERPVWISPVLWSWLHLGGRAFPAAMQPRTVDCCAELPGAKHWGPILCPLRGGLNLVLGTGELPFNAQVFISHSPALNNVPSLQKELSSSGRATRRWRRYS